MIGDQPSDEQAADAAGIPYVGVGPSSSTGASVARLLGLESRFRDAPQ
ncbi:hypothetical protein [Barrientosiimonas endolithica]|nr:hypothetical protein [Barrientosiimonas endolithica]